ncbi:MAG: retention module-containing protein, partial [Desulfobulbaceae bacterium]
METGNQPIGSVAILYGNAKAISIDGTERILSPNSPVFAYDRIITESDGRVSIIINDPAASQIDIGRMSHIIIDEDIFAGVTEEDIAASTAEIQEIQEALLAEGFDPTVELEAPAAGGTSVAGGGHPVANFARVTHEGEITSGAETTGITGDTVDPIPGIFDDAQNSPPDANNDLAADDDSLTTSEDTALTIEPATLLNNDTDVDGDSLTITGYSQPSNGEVTTDTQGNLVYTPDADFNGNDTFTYTISDGMGGTDTASVTITVNPVNDAPVAVDDTGTSAEDSSIDIDVLANDTDLDGDSLTVESFTQPDHGTVTENSDGTLNYAPDADYNGSDSFTYTISDGQGGTDTATITLTVNPVNDPPVAVDDTGTSAEDSSINIDVLANDTDLDGDSLTVESFTQPDHGTVTENSDGTLNYAPDADYNGSDSFTYTTSDGQGGTDTATVTLTVNPANDAPVAVDDLASTAEDTSQVIDVTGNDYDIDGTIVAWDVTVQATNGSVANNGDGTFTYTPNANFNGTDTFTYQVTDNDGAMDTAVVTVSVDDVNDAPVAIDDAVTTLEDTSQTIDVTDNDYDVDGTIDPTTVEIVNNPTNGTVINNGDGTVTYTPDPNYTGPDS